MRRRILLVLVLLATLFATPPEAKAAGGAEFFGSTAGRRLDGPIVGMARSSTGRGYWLVGSDGSVFAFGDARHHGHAAGLPLRAGIVAIAATPDNGGYWLVASDGGIFNYGNARFLGSAVGKPLNGPVVGMAARSDGAGYWLAASDGGIFAFGTAAFFGSAGGIPLNQPIVGIAARPTNDGYWLVARDGGIFAFGKAPFRGSTGGIKLNQPINGMTATPTGDGYWLVASDGGLFAFNAPFLGSLGGRPLNAPITGMAATPSGGGYWMVARDGGIFAFPTGAPTLNVATLVGGLTIPWDLAFTPNGTMLFTERAGRISAMVGGQRITLATVPDMYAEAESGVLGLVVDPNFASNRRIFVCQSLRSGDTPIDVRVYQWTVAADYTSATRGAAIVTGIPINTGRHNGCRLRFGADGMLWIGTGDAAIGTAPQDLDSLAGKVLRVVPDTGAPAPGNPFGTLVYEYGHRNVQGLALRPGTSQMFSIEHGTSRDDEVNLMKAGANSGWDPVPGYAEESPMTDTAKFPNASQPVWASGDPTIATSGGTFLTGGQWRNYHGALALACLKGRQVRILFLDAAGSLLAEEVVLQGLGRLRSPVQGPDGKLYITTSNGGGNDRILVVSPS